MIKLLRKNKDLFVSNILKDLKGIAHTSTEHKLGVAPEAHLVRLKMCHLRAERREAANVEIEKLLRARFIRPVRYPTWLSNVIMVKKTDSTWRMCVDFTNLNKPCLKDNYPIPSMDHLVDKRSRLALLSFMDAHSGYNQIPMAKEDEEKTSFITEQGTFCFRVISFGLQNVGATFQTFMDQTFVNQIGRNTEVYMDDILV